MFIICNVYYNFEYLDSSQQGRKKIWYGFRYGVRFVVFIPTNFLCLFKFRVDQFESESELFTGDTSKDNHSPGPVLRVVSPY